MDAGWYADPTGRHEYRYWDGNAWSDNVSDRGVTSVDAVDGPPAAPAVPAPPQQSYVPPSAAQPLGEPPTIIVKHRSRWPWIVLAIFVLFGLGVVGCVALVGTAANEVIDEMNEEQQRHAISQAEFDAIPMGATRDAVISSLGKQPTDQTSLSSHSDGFDYDRSCIYYWETGETFGTYYQFCFDETGALTTKNAF